MRIPTTQRLAAFAFLAAFAAAPAGLNAQDPSPQCEATIAPGQLSVGETATRVTISMSLPIGPIMGIEASEGSGIALSSPADLPRTQLAAGEGPPRPIRMGDAPNTWDVWLNLSEAEEGTHEIMFQSESGTCSAEITIGAG